MSTDRNPLLCKQAAPLIYPTPLPFLSLSLSFLYSLSSFSSPFFFRCSAVLSLSLSLLYALPEPAVGSVRTTPPLARFAIFQWIKKKLRRGHTDGPLQRPCISSRHVTSFFLFLFCPAIFYSPRLCVHLPVVLYESYRLDYLCQTLKRYNNNNNNNTHIRNKGERMIANVYPMSFQFPFG